jgi:hypothetical protein
MTIMAIWMGVFALGLFVAAIVAISKGRFGRAAAFAVLAFAIGGVSGAFAAAA